MPTFEVFCYWNIRELQLVFNAVAAIVGGSDYLGLLRTLALVGVISMAMAVLAGFAQMPDFGRWLIMLAVFNAILLVPKVNVVLTDRTGTQPQVTVANVPLGLASFAHSVSHIGDWLTRTFETTFALPNDIQFRTNGTLWGHRVQQELLHSRFDNSILTSNLMEFYRECVTPEFATGFIVASDMAKTNDIWTYLNGKTNPGRMVTLRAVPGAAPAAGTYGCDVAYNNLSMQITYVDTLQMNTLGKRMYPGLATAPANAAIQSSIQTSTNYMLGISSNAMDTVRQTAMSNFMIDAQYMLPAQLGDAAGAASNLAQAQAIRSTSESYKMMSKLAESTMPKVKNIVEIVQYSVFPIILLMVLMAGHKGGLVFKVYVMSLAWVQLWPPLYAVMHLVMTMHAQDLAAMTSGLGLSMSQYSLVNNAYISDEAIAGMIAATAIPAIAAAIVKGGDVGAQAIAGMVSPSREAEKAASGMASGNMQFGNASLGNQSADNLSMGQYNSQPTITSGTLKSTMVTNDARMTREAGTTTLEAAGSRLMANSNTGAIVSATLAGFNLSGTTASSSLSRGASDTNYSGTGTASQTGINASLGDAVTARMSKEQSAGFQRAFEQALAEKTGTSDRGGTAISTGHEQQTRTGSGGSTGLSNQESAHIGSAAGVRAGGSVGQGKPENSGATTQDNGRIAKIANALGVAGGWIMKKVPVGASAGIDVKTGQQYSEDAKRTLETATKDELKQATTLTRDAMREVAATTKDAGTKVAAERIASTLDTAKTYDYKEIVSLVNTSEAGNRKQEGNENRVGANIDQSRLLWEEATKAYFGKSVDNINDITPKQFREFAEEWNRNPGFRDDVGMQVREDLRKGDALHAGIDPLKTPDEIQATGGGNLNSLTRKGKAQTAAFYGQSDHAAKQSQYASPESMPNLTPVAKSHEDRMRGYSQQVQQNDSKVALDSGITLAATALYQDRQRGVGQVIGNALLGGAGSASMQDYTKALTEAAQKDPELASGLRNIALNQRSGKEPEKEEIQWVNDRANGAIQKSEGVLSEVNAFGEKILNDATGGVFKPDASKPLTSK